MLQETALRMVGTLRTTGGQSSSATKHIASWWPSSYSARAIEADIILEPEGRNTAPAVALAALHALAGNGDGGDEPLLLIMPADHVIRDIGAFRTALAAGVAAARDGQLVTFGVVPTSPHTGYGYIEADAVPGAVVPVRSFVEKPDAEAAAKYPAVGTLFLE